jgi:hypothetical protein
VIFLSADLKGIDGLSLIGRSLRAGVMVDTELQPSIEGTNRKRCQNRKR